MPRMRTFVLGVLVAVGVLTGAASAHASSATLES